MFARDYSNVVPTAQEAALINKPRDFVGPLSALCAHPSRDGVALCDMGGHRAFALSAADTVTQKVGGKGRAQAQMLNPRGVAVTHDEHGVPARITASDSSNNRLQTWTMSNSRGRRRGVGHVLDAEEGRAGVYVIGERGSGPGQLLSPGGCEYVPGSDGELVVADTSNHRVQIFHGAARQETGLPSFAFGEYGAGRGGLRFPADVAYHDNLTTSAEHAPEPAPRDRPSWFLGTAPRSKSLDRLEGAEPGAFVVRQMSGEMFILTFVTDESFTMGDTEERAIKFKNRRFTITGDEPPPLAANEKRAAAAKAASDAQEAAKRAEAGLDDDDSVPFGNENADSDSDGDGDGDGAEGGEAAAPAPAPAPEQEPEPEPEKSASPAKPADRGDNDNPNANDYSDTESDSDNDTADAAAAEDAAAAAAAAAAGPQAAAEKPGALGYFDTLRDIVCAQKYLDKKYMRETRHQHVIAVADERNHRVALWSYVPRDGYIAAPTARHIGNLGDKGGPTAMSRPCGVSFSQYGDLCVADSGHRRVLVYGPDRTLTHCIGSLVPRLKVKRFDAFATAELPSEDGGGGGGDDGDAGSGDEFDKQTVDNAFDDVIGEPVAVAFSRHSNALYVASRAGELRRLPPPAEVACGMLALLSKVAVASIVCMLSYVAVLLLLCACCCCSYARVLLPLLLFVRPLLLLVLLLLLAHSPRLASPRLRYEEATQCLRPACWALHNLTKELRDAWELPPMQKIDLARARRLFVEWCRLPDGSKLNFGPPLDAHGDVVCKQFLHGTCTRPACGLSHRHVVVDERQLKKTTPAIELKHGVRCAVCAHPSLGVHFWWRHEATIGLLFAALAVRTDLDTFTDTRERGIVAREVIRGGAQVLRYEAFVELVTKLVETSLGVREWKSHPALHREPLTDKARGRSDLDVHREMVTFQTKAAYDLFAGMMS